MFYYYGRWVEDASCRDNPDADPDVWFDDPTQARKICIKCPVKDQCLFTALELIQRGETLKGIWGGLSAIQIRRAMENPANIPKMRGQRSRAKQPPVFMVPLIPEELLPQQRQPADGTVSPFPAAGAARIDVESLMTSEPSQR